MARRRPVVVSDLEALREITSDLGAGLAIPADDVTALATALAALQDDSRLYERYASAARGAAERMSWSNAAAQIRGVYSNVMR
jgi:glycosyltransferase involved in cell wall biosynthesis